MTIFASNLLSLLANIVTIHKKLPVTITNSNSRKKVLHQPKTSSNRPNKSNYLQFPQQFEQIVPVTPSGSLLYGWKQPETQIMRTTMGPKSHKAPGLAHSTRIRSQVSKTVLRDEPNVKALCHCLDRPTIGTWVHSWPGCSFCSRCYGICGLGGPNL